MLFTVHVLYYITALIMVETAVNSSMTRVHSQDNESGNLVATQDLSHIQSP